MWAMSAGKVTIAIGKHAQQSIGACRAEQDHATQCAVNSSVFDFAVFMLIPWIE